MNDRIRPRRVLIIDDEPDVRQTYGDILRSVGFEVFTAEDACAGLGAALSLHPDVVLIDQRMPKITGVELASALRADLSPAPRMILITALPTVDVDPTTNASPFSRVLFKPVSVGTLVGAVEKALLEPAPDTVHP